MRHLSYIALILFGLTSINCEKTAPPVMQSAEGRFLLGGIRSEEVIERTVAPEGRKLEITNENGHITITGTSDHIAHLSFYKYAKARDESDSNLGLRDIKVEEKGSDTAYHYSVLHADRSEGKRVDVVANVPHGTPLSLILKNSDVKIDSFDGPIAIENRNGSISIASSSGDVTAVTQNGQIHITVATLSLGESISLETMNGSIDLQMPADLNVRVEAETAAGEIFAHGLTFEDVEFSETSVGAQYQGRLGEGGRRLSAKTRAGNISLRAFKALEELPLPTVSGDSSVVTEPDSVRGDHPVSGEAIVPYPSPDSIRIEVE